MTMQNIRVDGSRWRSESDMYDDLLQVLRAPRCGHNLDALWDILRQRALDAGPEESFLMGLPPPFSIEVVGLDLVPREVRSRAGKVQRLFREATSTFGLDVSMKLHWRPE